MKSSFLLNLNALKFTIPIILLGTLVFLMSSPLLLTHNKLSLAISLDLLLTVPLIYFLLIRKSNIPKTTVVPVMLLGLLIGGVFFPKEQQNYLDWFKTWLMPIIELSVLTYVVFKVRKALKSYKELKGSNGDFYDTLKSTCAEFLPKKLVIPFATEVAVFYYAFVNWTKRPLAACEFSYHKKSTSLSLLLAFVLVIGAETVGLHYWLIKWNGVVAWILTALSIYTALQVLAYAKALSQRPISIDGQHLHLRYSIMAEAHIPLADIESIELSTKELEKNKWTRSLSPLGELESHNVVIRLNKENTLIGLYGIKKQVSILSLFIDEPNEFQARVESLTLSDK